MGSTSENRRLVVSTEIDSLLENFLISVEVAKFPRASSSTAGRPRQVAADRARAGGGPPAHRKCAKSRARHPPAHAATSLHDLTLSQAAKVSG